MAAPPPDNASLVERVDVTHELAILRIAPDAGVPAFEPGQFTNVGLVLDPGPPPVFEKRAYSIASPPGEAFELFVRRLPAGRFTPRLFAVPVGGRLWVDARVHGRFTLEPIPESACIALVGTDTGVAPYLSMIRRYQGARRWERCVLLHSCRTRADLGYHAELAERAATDPAFQYLPTLTRELETSAWAGLRGRVQAHLEPEAFERLTGAPLEPARWHVLLCGNPGMIASVGSQLVDRGFAPHRRRSPGQIHAERYW